MSGVGRGRRAGPARSSRGSPVADHEDAVGIGGRLRVVGHEHDRLVALDTGAPQRVEDLDAGRVVEVAGGLVGEQERRAGDHRPGDGDALLLPHRELVGLVALLPGEVDPGDGVADRARPALLGAASCPAIVNGSATFSTTSSSGTRLNDWKTKPVRSRRSRVTSSSDRSLIDLALDHDARPKSAGRGRPAAGAGSTCPSPTGPSGRRTRPPRPSARRRAGRPRWSRRAGRTWPAPVPRGWAAWPAV